MVISRMTARAGSDNNTFFRAGRKSPWYLVAFGMIGASVSGISFVSVPGMVLSGGMTYLQTCMGFIIGYLIVAFVLLPLYYRNDLTSIYTYLRCLGPGAYKTGASFFLLSKMTGTAAKFFVPCYIITESLVADMPASVSSALTGGGGSMLIPFFLVAVVMTLLIWLYTRRGGIKTLVWTDTLQTACMIVALALIIYKVSQTMDMSVAQAFTSVWHDEHSYIFEFSDWESPRFFWKQFLSGIFIVIVMTGLDQDMMQKNLTCKSLRDAQKDMCCYGLAFLPVNMLFLMLGILLVMLCGHSGVAIPERADSLLTMFAASGQLGTSVLVLFTIGIIAASFSSADSALTAITTSFCVDILGMDASSASQQRNESLRKRIHVVVAILFVFCVIAFKAFEGGSLIDTIYTLVSYTYGPLLGLFAYAMMRRDGGSHASLCGRWVALVCLLSPCICYILNVMMPEWTGYHFGYELLMLNGLLTYAGLYIVGKLS